MDSRLEPVPVVAAFAHEVREVVELVGLYAVGSLAMGGYRPGVSDLDLVAVISAPVDERALRVFHRRFAREHAAAARLHCAYEPGGVYWAHGRILRRPLDAIARAELLAGGVVVCGPAPAELFPPVGVAELRAAAEAELAGYWRRAVRRPWWWLDERIVDLGLLTVVRARAAIADGRLITKADALTQLDAFGVPAWLCAEIARRRRGNHVAASLRQRIQRAAIARRIVARAVRQPDG